MVLYSKIEAIVNALINYNVLRRAYQNESNQGWRKCFLGEIRDMQACVALPFDRQTLSQMRTMVVDAEARLCCLGIATGVPSIAIYISSFV